MPGERGEATKKWPDAEGRQARDEEEGHRVKSLDRRKNGERSVGNTLDRRRDGKGGEV